MNKISNLREWLSLDESARYLSAALAEEVSRRDLLQLGVEGHLTLSVNLKRNAECHPCKIVPLAEAETVKLLSGEPVPVGMRLDNDRVIVFDDRVVTIFGAWDIAEFGPEYVRVWDIDEHPTISFGHLEGVFVQSLDASEVYRLLTRFDSIEIHDLDSNKVVTAKEYQPYNNPKNYFPADGFPTDSEIVVRPRNLMAFLSDVQARGDGGQKPAGEQVGDGERDKLLKQIGALSLLLAEKANSYRRGDKPNGDKIAKAVLELVESIPDSDSNGLGNSSLRESIAKGIKLLKP
ncbi:hypothetical protein [Paraburkholderia phenazinium]|uniref:Uncharacterized protein n=1 Tax=Paraburkholderia phenazinium TaxID=60549 RepID=A0A1G8FKI0_9BURK|nr:hypothetical protein [Paraburkholderia phenazinium]SDH82663.1 hypothetical protein SAMN05216466_113225 [Paraburkholderia phenazinium]